VPRVLTAEAVPLELPVATLPSRLVAAAIDLVAVYGALLLVLGLLSAALARALDPALAAALVLTLLVLATIGVPVLLLVLTRGRTLGKMAMGLRVVREDGGPIAFRQALVRELGGFVIEKPGPFFFAPAVVVALAREDGRRIGDLLAGTLVISERVVGRSLPPPPMPPGAEAWAAGLDLSRLSDELALRCRGFLDRAGQLRPEAREALGARLVAAVATAVGPVPPGVAGWQYLAAVLAERRRRDAARTAARPVLTPGGTLGATVGRAAYDAPYSP